jgi:hypothetical protein
MAFDFKNASKANLRKEYGRIARETGDDRFFTRNELNYLPEILSDREQVLAFSSGLMDGNTWLIVLTDKRIIFLDKGMIYGLKQTSINLNKINSISGQTGLIFGKITIEDGASSRLIDKVQKKTVRAFTNKARDAIEANIAALRHPANGQSGDDVVTKLERLAALLAQGVNSQREFVAQKAKLLR